MARRATLRDVAQAAGVSVATVDRALNGRETVREETLRQVAEAAHRVGYHAARLLGQRLDRDLPALTLGVVLNKERQAFYRLFAAALDEAARAAQGARVRVVVDYATSQAPGEFARRIRDLGERCDAVAATAVAHHEVADAVADLRAAGRPCFALLNDFAPGIRQNYLGLNNLKVGRIAAQMLALSVHRPGRLAVFVGGYRWHGHELRETGFRSHIREHAPQFQVLDTLVNLETRQLTYEATLDLLVRQPELRGIYVAGGGMEGAIAALREARAPGEVRLVVNELTPESRAALLDGYAVMAIATPLDELCRDLVAQAAAAVSGGGQAVPGQHFLTPRLYLAEAL